jgi:hypothetical protein
VTIVVLLILAVLWAVVLVPPLVRARGERSRRRIGTYTTSLGALGGSRAMGGGLRTRAASPFHGARVSARTARRRRDLLSLLGMVALVSLAGAALSGQAAIWALFVLCVAALGLYVYAIVWFDRLAAERAYKVRYLPARRMSASPIVVRRYSSS